MLEAPTNVIAETKTGTGKRHKAEEIIAKLRQVEVLIVSKRKVTALSLF